MLFIELKDKVFDKLTVLGRAEGDNPLDKRNARWLCQCQCGNQVIRLGSSLRRSPTHSCKRCEDHRHITHGMTGTAECNMWRHARLRARRDGIPFSLDVTDITIPQRCPVLGIQLVHGHGRPVDGSPSLDRLVPELGYVVGNVAVVSHKLNRLKGNMPLATLEAIVNWMRIRLEEQNRANESVQLQGGTTTAISGDSPSQPAVEHPTGINWRVVRLQVGKDGDYVA